MRRKLSRAAAAAVGLAVAHLLVMPARDARADTPDPDPWFGRDKALHFGASAVIAGGAYAVAATQFEARGPRLLVGGATAIVVGAAKEGADALGLGDPSWRDFTWDIVGAAAGLVVAWVIDVAVRGLDASHPAFVRGTPTQ